MAIDKKPLAFFIYLFGLFISSIRGKHKSSFKTWFCAAAQQASACKKIPPFSTHSEWQAGLLPACKGREGAQLEMAQQGQRGARDTTSSSASPWLSKWHLRGCSVLPWASVLQAKQKRSWFVLDASTAGWSWVCYNPREGMAFLLNLKDAHSSSQCK